MTSSTDAHATFAAMMAARPGPRAVEDDATLLARRLREAMAMEELTRVTRRPAAAPVPRGHEEALPSPLPSRRQTAADGRPAVGRPLADGHHLVTRVDADAIEARILAQVEDGRERTERLVNTRRAASDR